MVSRTNGRSVSRLVSGQTGEPQRLSPTLAAARLAGASKLRLEDRGLLNQAVDLPPLPRQHDREPQQPDEYHDNEQHQQQARRVEHAEDRRGTVE